MQKSQKPPVLSCFLLSMNIGVGTPPIAISLGGEETPLSLLCLNPSSKVMKDPHFIREYLSTLRFEF